jgi:hypothetical protein
MSDNRGAVRIAPPPFPSPKDSLEKGAVALSAQPSLGDRRVRPNCALLPDRCEELGSVNNRGGRCRRTN